MPIRDACRAWVSGPLRETLAAQIKGFVSSGGRIELDGDDRDGQTLLVWYPATAASQPGYVRPAVRIECGAKSALDPHRDVLIRPYIAEDAPELNISVPGVTTIEPPRTFWDKIVIVHGLRRWHEKRGELRQEGQRVSRHITTSIAFFTRRPGLRFAIRPWAPIVCAMPGCSLIALTLTLLPQSRALSPSNPTRTCSIRSGEIYANTLSMIFGAAPAFEEIMTSIDEIDAAANRVP
jgi:nucleotidyltransferase AbiEii toxin of type IV toxin-antitoxin system